MDGLSSHTKAGLGKGSIVHPPSTSHIVYMYACSESYPSCPEAHFSSTEPFLSDLGVLTFLNPDGLQSTEERRCLQCRTYSFERGKVHV